LDKITRSVAPVVLIAGDVALLPTPGIACTVCATKLIDGAVTVSVSVVLPVPALLVALSVTIETPVPLGVPEIIPVVVFTDKPAGSPAAPKLVGEFVAAI
jgi:hypothetical protein